MLCLISSMSRLCSILFLVFVALVQVGCSGNGTTPTSDNIDSTGQAQSSVPWNRPESGETQGQLGGMSH